MFVKASHRSQSSLELLDLHGGLLRSRLAPMAPRLWDSSLYCFHSAYLWCILNFVSHTHIHSFSSLSLGLFHRALQHSLMRGKNTTAMKSPRLLRAFFSKLALSSPPERFLQIPVWGIVNTNFSLLKSPHIPAMLSFEWRTQGRPLNSFIVGFKTLHFKKYKSYSQMNEAERGDWREGLLMCPVGRHELSLSPQAAQIHSPVRRRLCPRDPALHTWHPFNSVHMQTQHCMTMRNNCSCLLLTNFKTVHSWSHFTIFSFISKHLTPAWSISRAELPYIWLFFVSKHPWEKSVFSVGRARALILYCGQVEMILY